MNTFYHGDCLFVMNHDIDPNSVDLIYLDPPFFTGEIQKGKWRPDAMEVSFEDSKQFWKEKGISTHAPMWLKHIAVNRPDFASYLFYMMERLLACHKVLKDGGSIYLHCDYRASHYLKMIMDEPDLFGNGNYQNEIIWHYENNGTKRKYNLAKGHETIFYYAKGKPKTWHVPLKPYSKELIKSLKKDDNGYYYTRGQRTGRRDIAEWEKESKIGLKTYVDLLHGGSALDTVWEWQDVGTYPKKLESVGYPTQKPESLLKYIINASSNEGDLVLDPFCGCGTTVIEASKLNRKCIGIDIDTSKTKEGIPTAFSVIKQRSHELFGQAQDVSRDLSEISEMNPQEFEKWVNEYYKATKPMPDKGIDGVMSNGTPIQTKTFLVKYEILDKFMTASKLHPSVKQPVKGGIIVSQVGFDESATKRQFQIEQLQDIKIELVTPEMMLNIDNY